jgi:hypothetical protein
MLNKNLRQLFPFKFQKNGDLGVDMETYFNDRIAELDEPYKIIPELFPDAMLLSNTLLRFKGLRWQGIYNAKYLGSKEHNDLVLVLVVVRQATVVKFQRF